MGPVVAPRAVGKKSWWSWNVFPGHPWFSRRDAVRTSAPGVEVADWLTRFGCAEPKPPVTCSGSPPNLGFRPGTGFERLKNSSAATVLEVEIRPRTDWRSTITLRPSSPSVAGFRPGERTAPDRARAAVLALRAAQGMVLRPNPIATPGASVRSPTPWWTGTTSPDCQAAVWRTRPVAPAPGLVEARGKAGWLGGRRSSKLASRGTAVLPAVDKHVTGH